MTNISDSDQIPCRYGLDELPADISRRELLYFFSFSPDEIRFVTEKGRFPSYQIVIALHLGAYTDIVFALTYLLGFRLAPRMAKLPDLTLWYGKGHDVEYRELFNGRITEESIAGQWDAVQRISATIQDGRTRASQIIRKISAFNRKHSLFKSLRNLGRLARTRHIIEVASDKEYQRSILQGLNKGESRNALAKDLRFAGQGVIREKDPDMRLCVASSINLMILCIAIWNTIYTQRGAIRRGISHGFFSFSHSPLFFIATMGLAAPFRSTVLALGSAVRDHLSFTATDAGAIQVTAVTFSANIES